MSTSELTSSARDLLNQNAINSYLPKPKLGSRFPGHQADATVPDSLTEYRPFIFRLSINYFHTN